MAMATAAHLAADDGDLPAAVRLAARAQEVFGATGFEHAAAEQGPTIAALLERARAEFGEDRFVREEAAGREMPLPDAIALADRVLVTLAGAA